MATMRLQKLLAQAGMASRRGAEAMISAGEVTVNGQVVTALGTTVNPTSDRVEVRGTRLKLADPEYRILLKPRSCLATLEKDQGAGNARPTLFRYVPDAGLGFSVVAPLDFLSEGVILLTTDGDLAAKMSRGGGRVPMTYHLKLQGGIDDSALDRLRRGWRWDGRLVQPSRVDSLATTGKNTWIEMVVAESRPRVIKAAGETIRHTVLKISRVRLGDISFEGLKMGESRDLTKEELKGLLRSAGSAGRPGTAGSAPPARRPPVADRPSSPPPSPRRPSSSPRPSQAKRSAPPQRVGASKRTGPPQRVGASKRPGPPKRRFPSKA